MPLLRNIALIIFLVGQGMMAYGQGQEKLEFRLRSFGHPDGQLLTSLTSLRDRIESRPSSEEALLEKTFARVHRKFLNQYVEDASFSELTSGKYTCVTATALYAALFESMGLKVSVYETPHHVFLIVQHSKGSVLIETTDPIGGFVKDQKEVNKRLISYQSRNQVMATTTPSYQFRDQQINQITIDQLAGLLHYNLAVKNFNNGLLEASVRELELAFQYYRSPRLNEFSKILTMCIANSPLLNIPTKESLMRRIKGVKVAGEPMATNKH